MGVGVYAAKRSRRMSEEDFTEPRRARNTPENILFYISIILSTSHHNIVYEAVQV
jgi:hypothetical protein